LTRPENILKNKSRIFDVEYLKNGFFVQALHTNLLICEDRFIRPWAAEINSNIHLKYQNRT